MAPLLYGLKKEVYTGGALFISKNTRIYASSNGVGSGSNSGDRGRGIFVVA
jgi:hypothetical protein